MYSKDLQEMFDAEHIKPGDIIKIEWQGNVLEGALMPKSEAGSEDTIILKLKNGYNIGVNYHNIKLKKISSKKLNKFPFSNYIPNPELPNISIIWTGGTIGSKIDYIISGVSMTVKPEELLYYIPELAKIANINIIPLFSISSEDMTFIEWQKISEEVIKALNNGSRGIVITHGTDTMHYTASALAFMLQNLNAPIVLTGSQRSSDRGSSDAFFNLISAVRFAANSDIAEVGICMHSNSSDDEMLFIRGVKARKMHTSRRDAFRAINDKPIASITKDGNIKYLSSYKKILDIKEVAVAKTGFEPIVLIKVHPNSDPEIIDYYMQKGIRGFIIEGTGLGHTPVSVEHEGFSWLPYIKNAVANGVVVGMTSQCLYGRVNENVYKNLRILKNAGVIFCEDMLPETAYVKLGWLLANYNVEKAKEMLKKNLVGEIKNRTIYDEFLI
ncbi:MAG: Glu-tRNA(Gln) amidotransferase subunit GatD [Candidatus Marsarchaeota archaeon]|nr:Glu-tRNA(Gln) amidotransferase subunit GatD [Candidatus Marsarchaeota archaeon]